MATDADPIVGNWYQHLDKGQSFEVIALDEDIGLVEIQYFDGSVEELDLDAWYELEIEPIEAPEDWTGPVDDIARDDLNYSETGMDKADWTEPVRDQRRRRREGWEEDEEEQEDGLDEDHPEEEAWQEDED